MRLLDPAHARALPAGSELAAAYVCAISPDPPSMVRNVRTRMALLDTGEHLFPVTVNDGEEGPDISYVASPQSAYTGYAAEEVRRLQRPLLAFPLLTLIRGVGALLRAARIDRAVVVNNWLLSTNLYPHDWHGADIPAITSYLEAAFPGHAFGFRSLNAFGNRDLMARFRDAGYLPVASRQVYMFDGRPGARADFLCHHDTKKDARLLERSPYRWVAGAEFDAADYRRAEELYNLLYIHKYCHLNPQFTAAWLERGQRDGWLQLHGLRDAAGRLAGVLGLVSNGPVFTPPIVGYDTALPIETGLYRMLTRFCLAEAQASRRVLNFSAGAAEFKRRRGGVPQIEYSMVRVAHLPALQRAAWRTLAASLDAVAVPLMKQLKL